MNGLAGKEFKIGQKHSITIDARATFSGGKYYTPIDLEASKARNTEVLLINEAYSKKYPNYFRLDIKPGYRLNSKKLTHEWSVDVQNVTRNNNVFQQTYDIAKKNIKTDYQLKFFVIPQYRILF